MRKERARLVPAAAVNQLFKWSGILLGLKCP